MLIPSNTIEHKVHKQATLGKSGYELEKPGVVRPVTNLGAEFPGLDFPLATK